MDDFSFSDDLIYSDYSVFMKWLKIETKAFDVARAREARAKIENESREVSLLVAETDTLTRKLRGF